MYPPIFAIAAAYSPLTALLGVPPDMRFYPFGEAPQGVIYPYAVWQTAYGTPENYLSGRPDIDNWGVQIDVYAKDEAAARDVAEKLRDALELSAHVVAWRGESQDPQTKSSRVSFDMEFWTQR